MLLPKDMTDWMNRKQNTHPHTHIYIYKSLSPRQPPHTKGYIQSESEGLFSMKKIFHANGNPKKAGVEKISLDKTELKI